MHHKIWLGLLTLFHQIEVTVSSVCMLGRKPISADSSASSYAWTNMNMMRLCHYGSKVKRFFILQLQIQSYQKCNPQKESSDVSCHDRLLLLRWLAQTMLASTCLWQLMAHLLSEVDHQLPRTALFFPQIIHTDTDQAFFVCRRPTTTHTVGSPLTSHVHNNWFV